MNNVDLKNINLNFGMIRNDIPEWYKKKKTNYTNYKKYLNFEIFKVF